MLYPYGFLLFGLIVINIILYHNPNILNVMLSMIKKFFSRRLLFLAMLLGVFGTSHNVTAHEPLLSAGVSDRQHKTFYYALAWHLKHEGPWSNHPSDPGGFTYAGISKVAHANWHGWQYLLENGTIPDHVIASFYDSLVWKPMMCDSMPPELAFYLFDTACLLGTPYATYLLQKSLNVTPDGIIGPNTLHAIRSQGTRTVLSKLHTNRITFHKELVNKYPNLKIFYKGWLRRANLTYQQAIGMLSSQY